MKTFLGQELADHYSKSALKQIADWADNAAAILKTESQQCFRDKRTMAVIRPIMEDQQSFEALSSAIKELLK